MKRIGLYIVGLFLGSIFLAAMGLRVWQNAYMTSFLTACTSGSDLDQCLNAAGGAMAIADSNEYFISSRLINRWTDYVVLSKDGTVTAVVNYDSEQGRRFLDSRRRYSNRHKD